MTQLWRDLRQTWQEWQEDDGNVLAAAMAYYTALSFLPLLLLLISAFGVFLQFTQPGQNAQEQILQAIDDYGSPVLRRQVKTALAQVKENAGVGGPVGLITLLLAAISIFAQFEKTFDRLWEVEDPERRGVVAAIRDALYERLRAFVMLLVLGLLLVVVFVAGMTLTAVQEWSGELLPAADWIWRAVPTGVSLVLTTAVFTLIYRVLPKAPVRWREAARGAVLAAVTWEIGRQVLASFVIGNKYSSAYGLVGAFIAIMLWIYYASTVIFIGAEYVQVICRRCAVEK